MTTPQILINPRMKWACPPTEQTRLKFVDGQVSQWPKLPQEGDVLTLPFILCPHTLEPVPVRVVQIQKMQDSVGHLLAVVVMRADQTH
jgi:hypothetical protein